MNKMKTKLMGKWIVAAGIIAMSLIIAGSVQKMGEGELTSLKDLKLSDFTEVFKKNVSIVIGDAASRIELQALNETAPHLENKVLGTIFMVIIGTIFMAIGGLILAYPAYKPEDVRAGRKIGKIPIDRAQIPINRAINRLGKPYWTDRKIYILGATITVLGAILVILGLK